jgi:APA family basic amino acid/polyamine antiporter
MLLDRVKPLATILAEGSDQEHGLKRSLGPWALTAMGIGAIIGTGIFVLTGVASATRAGPSLTISFVVAGIVSALAALCYAEVSSKIPISGSAYTYTYATFGETLAWIVGWGLILEYAVGAATVSVGWSGYFTNILQNFGIPIPQMLQHNPWDATPGIANLPAGGIILLITALLVRGTKESGTVNAVIVAFKLLVVLFFIAMGVGHINTAYFHLPAGPATHQGGFFPFGINGMLSGAAFIFFAYIGFDAVSTSAEEAKDPKKDLPFGILMSLAVCTVLYIIVVYILNGMVPFYKLGVSYPVAFAMNSVGLTWAGTIISFGAIAGLTTVLLVMMFGQARIFFAMSRDGLIPPSFTKVHPTWRTPIFSQIFFGVCIATAGALFPLGILGSVTNLGTLMAFILTSLAVPLLRNRHPELKGSFVVPLGPYLLPILAAVSAAFLIYYLRFNNPVVFGFFPIVWFIGLVWLILGLLFYVSYGRNKSTVALQQAEGVAAAQPRVN